MGLYYLIIFVTGAGTLALELLASRVLTPYFGVSLYIWSSILAITLTFLAIGYYAGGRLARAVARSRLPFAFFAAPAVSALAIVAACLVYPWLFPALAAADLVLGSVAAATLLLAVPLVVLSAMNPLLIAIRPETAGDAGAGRVFFVSTIGSVAGVVATAFLIIPQMTNFRGLLLLAILLAALPLAGTATAGERRRRLGLVAAAAVGLVLAGALFALAPAYLGKDRDVIAGDYRFRVQAEYSSVFGNLKIVAFADRNDPSRSLRLILTDGLVQNRLLPDGRSYSEYTYMLEALASAYAPEARTALVLGLGAGVVPRTLATRGLAVDVVEINADMLAAVRAHVEAAPAWQTHIGDARTFVRACRQRYDLAVVDLFHGDGTPDYLLSADFFRDLRQCLTPAGVTVMNAFVLDRRSANYRSLIATVQSVFPHLVVFRRPNQPDEPSLNTYLVAAAAAPTPASVRIANVPADLQEGIAAALRNREVVARAENGVIVTDAHNVFSILNAADQMILRQLLVQQLPPQMLAN
ncbi:MAG: spermidine synthase [Dongiaceae bacterium]